MNLVSEFLNGTFGDPALYVTAQGAPGASLFDCGDLTRYTPGRLLRVGAIFLSHCHIDHFFAFDLYLRVNIGGKNDITIFGPPGTSLRVGGKLQGYTWNLIDESDLRFIAIDLEPEKGTKTTTSFRAHARFHPSEITTEPWDPTSEIYATADYGVKTVMLDHRTPSLMYAAQTHPSTAVAAENLPALGLRAGPWIAKLKEHSLDGDIEVWTADGGTAKRAARPLAEKLLIARAPQKIVYATDGAASPENRARMLPFLKDADLFYSETCFLERDRPLADDTKHFTAQFIAELANEAGVKRLAPFHFSKRYLDCPEDVYAEAAKFFPREIVRLTSQS